MTPVLSSTALVLHDLGLATSLGGTLFGQLGLEPAAKVISSKEDRGRIISEAWNRYKVPNLAGLGLAGLTWLIGRARFTGRGIHKNTRKLVVAKDILVGSMLATTIVNTIIGTRISREAPAGAVPVETGQRPARETPPRVASLQKLTTVLGLAQIVSVAGVIGLTAVLNFKAGLSQRWSLMARALP